MENSSNKPRVKTMSPRRKPDPHFYDPNKHPGSELSQDKERNDEMNEHHPMDHPHPHPDHHPQMQPDLPPRHHTHTHLHGDDLGPHTNPPGPIKPSKKMTKKGRE